MTTSFIERQFPVSKVSKESYKERKANNGQTLTGLGKWWGRKPLILCRATILGCLMPTSDNPARDNEIFLKILSMDEDGLWLRKEATGVRYSPKSLMEKLKEKDALWTKYAKFFEVTLTDAGEVARVKLSSDAPREEMEKAVFRPLGYDEKINLGVRPEHLPNISEQSWREINHHLGTTAQSLPELVEQLAVKRYGHPLTVGDCFCGGGSIPFEAARMGAHAYASDLNPVAGLLTWASINVCGASDEELKEIRDFQERVYDEVDREIRDLGIETNDRGDRAVSYLYCVEVKCPECGKTIPLAPSWVIGKGTKTVAKWTANDRGGFDVEVKMNAAAEEMKAAEQGTVTKRGICCPHCGRTTPIAAIRGDRIGPDGETVYGLRKWEKNEFEPRPDDVFHERLYAIKYEHVELFPNGKTKTTRYYQAPNARDLENERKVREIVAANFADWQQKGLVPSMGIESGFNTDQLIRERGWMYWHQLFNCRQLLIESRYAQAIFGLAKNTLTRVVGVLGLNKVADNNSKLCSWNNSAPNEKVEHTFYNQALNTMMAYGARGFRSSAISWMFDIHEFLTASEKSQVRLCDARNVDRVADVWLTDPPYADAVNYHELSEFFLAWDKKLLSETFPEWYADSKRALAVRGDEHFSQTMIDIYANLTRHMTDDGVQVVMFTHSDPAVWAQLALIMWKAGLTVTAAWNVATETENTARGGGNYVKGTVLLVLRKQTGDATAFLDELEGDIKAEVKRQIASMQALDPKEDPNFSDPDYILAAYAASLKVLTGYHSIGEIQDFDYELNLAIREPQKSEVVKLIERAKRLAYDSIIPQGFDAMLWRDLAPAERFYLKGVESEKHGLRQLSTYQEYARGFGLMDGYTALLASNKANEARLKSASELGMRTYADLAGFDEGPVRLVLQAIHIAIKEDDQPEKGLMHIKNALGTGYWDRREMLREILRFLADTANVDTMIHWHAGGRSAQLILSLLEGDHV